MQLEASIIQPQRITAWHTKLLAQARKTAKHCNKLNSSVETPELVGA